MRVVAIKDEFFKKFKYEKEILFNHNEQRPYCVVVSLKYKNHKLDFAIPFRTNINNYIDSNLYYKLPRKKSTKNNNVHGIHFEKMFPVNKKYYLKYNSKDPIFLKCLGILNKNKKEIVKIAQNFLDLYYEKSKYSVDIDRMIKELGYCEG